MLFFSFMLLTPLFPLYLSETFGATRQEIGFVLSGYTLTTLIVRPFSGYIVDNYSRKLVLLITYGCFALFFSGYLLAGSLLAFTVVRTLHGFPFGAATVSNSTVAIDDVSYACFAGMFPCPAPYFCAHFGECSLFARGLRNGGFDSCSLFCVWEYEEECVCH